MGFALAGKKTDNSIVLSEGFAGKRNDKGKPSTGKPGASVGHMGFLHHFLLAASLRETVFLNLLTTEQIESISVYPLGVGIPPWESMPQGEDCTEARALKGSLMGRLIPMGRFCLLSENGLHYSEGIAHEGYKSGVFDPSMAVDYAGKDPKALWTDPDKRPWRALTSLLSFFDQTGSKGFQSWQLVWALDRVRDIPEDFAIWSAGLRVSANAGEQYASGSDDYVDSTIWIHGDLLGESWFLHLRREMEALDALSKTLYGRVMRYYKELMVEGKNQAAQSTRCFWELSESDFQNLINACGNTEEDAEKRRTLRRRTDDNSHAAFNRFCAKDTARQLDAWAKHRPNNNQYLSEEVK
jgi:CRISPR system Cascade subunit CasA